MRFLGSGPRSVTIECYDMSNIDVLLYVRRMLLILYDNYFINKEK